jgi:hypothetical protein
MDELNRWAKDELRSLNAQIEYLLREAVRRSGRKTDRSHELEGEGGKRDQPMGRGDAR